MTGRLLPGKPAESHLVEQITPNKDGKAEMPQNKPAAVGR